MLQCRCVHLSAGLGPVLRQEEKNHVLGRLSKLCLTTNLTVTDAYSTRARCHLSSNNVCLKKKSFPRHSLGDVHVPLGGGHLDALLWVHT